MDARSPSRSLGLLGHSVNERAQPREQFAIRQPLEQVTVSVEWLANRRAAIAPEPACPGAIDRVRAERPRFLVEVGDELADVAVVGGQAIHSQFLNRRPVTIHPLQRFVFVAFVRMVIVVVSCW